MYVCMYVCIEWNQTEPKERKEGRYPPDSSLRVVSMKVTLSFFFLFFFFFFSFLLPPGRVLVVVFKSDLFKEGGNI